MSLQPGSSLGPYQILATLGAGGMGEVYKARDTRLDRPVAVKVLPEHLAENPDALARFEREAKAVAALNHPNITGIFDLGRAGATVYVAMELLEGESLRSALGHGPIGPRRATELAVQLAQGLAAAHDKGVVHRDLKPDNLWITRDGRLKILDFGLAKQLGPGRPGALNATEVLSSGPLTEQGMILGTMGYMSPELVRGEPADARADLFSFGAVLYEMLTGKRAFARASASETMAAILRDDPPEETTGRAIPLALRRIIDHCLEKTPERRFRDAHDLAFALDNLSSASQPPAALAVPFAPQNRRATRIWAGMGAALLVAVGLAGWALGSRPPPRAAFRRLTYGKGMVDGARFMPGSREILFSARWNGTQPEIFSLNPEAREPRALGIQGATLLAVAPSGELTVKLQPRLWAGFELGQLARVTPGGGRRIFQDAGLDADWMADGRGVALVRFGAPERRKGPPSSIGTALEFPAGHLLEDEAIFLWGLRVAPGGDRVACMEQPTFQHGDGHVVLLDGQGRRTVLAEVHGFTGLAWGPGGKEVWYSETREGSSSLWAVSPGGHRRLLATQAGLLELLDVAPDGRALATLGLVLKGTMGMDAPDFREKDLSWNEATYAHDIAPDGRSWLIGSGAGWSGEGERAALYLRKAGEPVPTQIGEGVSAHFMPDGRQALASVILPTPHLTLLPLGAGQPREIPLASIDSVGAEPLPDGRHAVVAEIATSGWFSLDLTTGAKTPFGEKGLSSTLGTRMLSPDGTRALLRHRTGLVLDDPLLIYPVQGGPPVPVKGLVHGDMPLGWNGDGRSIYVFNRDGLPARITRLDLATGARTLVREIMPVNPGGMSGIRSFAMTPDARHLAYNYVRKLSDLYLIEGLE